MIDFHCHLDLYPKPLEIAQECQRRGLYVLSVTTTPSAWKGTNALAPIESRIRTALGLHPQLAYERQAELELFDTLVSQAPYVGEIGLDGGPEYKSQWAIQVRVFEHILQSCSRAGGRVLSLHSRHASKDVLQTLERHSDAGSPVLHWFSGSKRDVEKANALGCWFSVGPAMLRTERGREMASRMPRNRVLTETDGPFAQVDGAPMLPWQVDTALGQLAGLWGVPEKEVESILRENLRQLVGGLQKHTESSLGSG